MKNVYFMRQTGCRAKRGYVADVPNNYKCSYVRPFIIVQIDETTIPDELLTNNTIQLKLDDLMSDNINTSTVYTDEDGVEQTIIKYGYYNELGVSSKPYPVITMEDVTYE